METSPPYIPQGMAVPQRGFGTTTGAARSFVLGAPYLPHQPWAEAVQAAIYSKNRTTTDVLDGKAQLEVLEDKPLGSFKHMHEWGSVSFKHVKARSRIDKISARAKKYSMVGCKTTSKTWRLWDPAKPFKITNSAEMSFREEDARDTTRPLQGSDPFPEPGQIFQPDITTGAETKDEVPQQDKEHNGQKDEGPSAGRRSGRPPEPVYVEAGVRQHRVSARHRGEIGNLGQGSSSQGGYIPANPPTYTAVANGPDAIGWIEVGRKRTKHSLITTFRIGRSSAGYSNYPVEVPDDIEILPRRIRSSAEIQDCRTRCS